MAGLSFNDPEVEVEKQFENVTFVDMEGELGVEVYHYKIIYNFFLSFFFLHKGKLLGRTQTVYYYSINGNVFGKT